MSRWTQALDRGAAMLGGLVLVCGGLAAIAWATGWPPSVADRMPERISTATFTDAAAEPWWPWALGIGGAATGLLALRWLLAHVPVRRSHPVTLPESDAGGRLRVDLRTIADAAAEDLGAQPGIAGARGTVRRDRGCTFVEVTARLEPRTTVAEATAAAGGVAARTREHTGDVPVAVRILLHGPPRRSAPSRVD